MQITVRTFAILRELSADRAVIELPPAARLEDAWAAMADRYPALQAHRSFVRPARAGAYAAWDAALTEGDEIAFLPPVSGGSTMTLTDGPIDVAALEAALARPGHGAVVTFVGRARDIADDGRGVLELEYEAYPEMADRRAERDRRRGRVALGRGRRRGASRPASCRSVRRRWRSSPPRRIGLAPTRRIAT